MRVLASFVEKQTLDTDPDRPEDGAVEEGLDSIGMPVDSDIADPDGIVPVNLDAVNNNGSSPAHLAALKGYTNVSHKYLLVIKHFVLTQLK